MEKILKLKEITKYYGSNNVITKALNGINLEVLNGEFVVIMGASGSGKSTLLNLVSTIDTSTSGSLEVEGINITNLKEKDLYSFRRDKLGFVFQDYNLLDNLNIFENISLPLKLKKLDKEEIKTKVDEVIKTLNIQYLINKFPTQLSGGEKQRVAIARAIITNPILILADEPTGALDSVNSYNIMKVFKEINENLKSTILLVTHDASVGAYASRVVFLQDGKIFSEIYRGNRNNNDMYDEIQKNISSLGVNKHV